ncbi:MAG: hypothetical protein Q4F95_02535 [Oscillospiraceae bacterium]|nr:hypothetical protein [Oscillospiraceae bacterium]
MTKVNALKKAYKIFSRHEWNLYKSVCDRKLQDSIMNGLRNMPVSSGSRYYHKLDARVGIISDEFIFETYKSSCSLIYLTPDNWRNLIGTLDIIILVSVWHGLNHEWDAAYRQGSAAFNEITKIKEAAAGLQVPVVFYSKEDPPNFNVFIDLACDVRSIFTSAAECIPMYNERFPETPCYCLPFAINPVLHNPVGMFRDKYENSVLFAGSWIKKYPRRISDQKNIFRWVRRSGFRLAIIDRNFNICNLRYQYPFKYWKNVISSFSYKEIASVYKMFTYTINLNSVCESDTMFANRVYDASACGCVIISNESTGMKKLFGHVCVVDSYKELKQVLSIKPDELYTKQLSAVRSVYRLNTIYENILSVLNSSSDTYYSFSAPSVCVVLPDNCKNEKTLKKMFDEQTYKNKFLIESGCDPQKLSGYDIVSFWGNDRKYGIYYLEDMINGFKYTDCSYITKGEAQHEYTEKIGDKYATVFWRSSYETGFLAGLDEKDIFLENGYSSDCANYEIFKEEKTI